MKAKDNEIKVMRIYEAPLVTVWTAWTDPKQVAQWWGPRGFSITTHERNLKPGGLWHYTMHGPDGTDYVNKTKYHEVEKYKKLVYDHGGNDEQEPLFRVTVLFSEQGKQTTMDMTMTLDSAEKAKEIRGFIKRAGGHATWDRLAEFVEKTISGKDSFVINRSFDAPIEVLFDMWTKPEMLSRWLPPVGFEMEYLRPVIKENSSAFYKMTGKDGTVMYGSIRYLKIQQPNLIVYLQDFRDKDEKISRHPHAPLWPAEMLTTVQFSDEGHDQTRVTVTWTPHGKFTAEELAAFVEARAGMTMGWTGSFDKLEGLLK